VSLPVRKKQRIKGQLGETGASAPTQIREERVGRSAVHLPKSRSSGDQTPARQGYHTPSKAIGAVTPVTGNTSSLPSRPSANFIKADSGVRLSLVQDIVKSWDLVALGTSDPLKVSEEEMAMAEDFPWGVKVVLECRRLEGLVSRYQRYCERLQTELESRETEKKELQCQLEKVAADAV